MKPLQLFWILLYAINSGKKTQKDNKTSPKNPDLPILVSTIREKHLIQLILPPSAAPLKLHKGCVAIWGQDFPAFWWFAQSREPIVTIRWWLLMELPQIAASSRLPEPDISCWSDRCLPPCGSKRILEVSMQRGWCFACRWVISKLGGGEYKRAKKKEPAATVFSNSQNSREQLSRLK